MFRRAAILLQNKVDFERWLEKETLYSTTTTYDTQGNVRLWVRRRDNNLRVVVKQLHGSEVVTKELYSGYSFEEAWTVYYDYIQSTDPNPPT